jgi:hypothetical protein
LLLDVWSTLDVWLLFDVGSVMVLDCVAVTPLVTVWLPSPTCTPGLMFAPAFTALLAMFAFASTPTFGFTLVLRPDDCEPLVPLVVLLPCVVEDVCPLFDVAPLIVDCWPAFTELFTLWLPSPTLMPGLMLAPAFTALLLMPTFASTPTCGFTLSVLPERLEPLVPLVLPPVVLPLLVVLVWPTEEPCVEFDVAPVLVDCWPAVTLLFTLWLPLPMFTPGLTFAPRFTSVLLMFAFGSTPTFGFTLSVGLNDELLEVDVEGDVAEALPLIELPVPEGVVLEAEPLREPLVLDAEPLSELPLVDGVPLAPEPLRPLPDAPIEPDVLPPLVVPPAMEPLVPLLVVVVDAGSSRQSWCTGLAECSLAAPVSLSASLPALGFL